MNKSIVRVRYHFDGEIHEIVDLHSKEGFCSISMNHWSGEKYKMYVPLKHITLL